MDLTKMPLFRMAQARMDWAAQRQRVLAQNVGQIDTPGYRPRDVAQPDFKRLATEAAQQPVQVAMTNPAHQPGTLPEADPFDVRRDSRTFETKLDGNTVVLEEQMQKMGQTRSRFMMAASLFERNIAMLKTAIGRQR
ncbi:flagellar basal body rod protein FlgB [Roseospira goensis]|uniref:Flagellar basal body rod protein FlgB n=1 Tax=Roseospira goensis TaxID=391922 RepID=A0A7W6RZL5_9PROT|nr:flagellar biosynthesis protein FlgB [Roseospira goensis]MBB4286148.1 flagellar basal-body rod protein FlgB [Roseospira goensis]